MELKDFIKKTLVDIKEGIHEANIELVEKQGKKLGVDASALFGIEANNREKTHGYISFDIAVTVAEETKKGGGGKIKVAVADLGGEAEKTASQENVSRIKFYVIPHTYIG